MSSALSGKHLLKYAMPGPIFRTLKDVRHSWTGNRHLSPSDRAARIAALADPMREKSADWVEVFKELEKLGLHLYPVHFYSPMPDTCELAAARERCWRETDMNVVNYNRDEETRLNAIFAAMPDESSHLPSAHELKMAGWGLGYGEIEALLLYKMIRHFKPKRVIEVGSGVSTVYCSDALRANGREGCRGLLTCVEPYPSCKLEASGHADRIVELAVQDIELAFFQELADGDVLFIDSSHVVRIGSDVNYLLLDVIPSLKPGVIIHLHDIPFPYVTPREFWVFERLMFWQEPVLLKALLTHNQTVEVIYCSSLLRHRQPEELKRAFPSFNPKIHFPSSIWLRKIA